eukprot:9311037-Alexandrium_andersonii.AAC.1
MFIKQNNDLCLPLSPTCSSAGLDADAPRNKHVPGCGRLQKALEAGILPPPWWVRAIMGLGASCWWTA